EVVGGGDDQPVAEEGALDAGGCADLVIPDDALVLRSHVFRQRIEQRVHVVLGAHDPRRARLEERRLAQRDTGAKLGKVGAPQLQAIDTGGEEREPDRKSTRLNSSHVKISYAVF